MELGLIIQDSKVVVSSRKVAEVYEKRHDSVLRDVRNVIDAVPEAFHNFVESSYTNEQNRKMPEYLMDRQGFSMLVTGFNGEKAKRFTYQYTLAFERMAEQITKPQVPQTYPEALRLAANLAEENEKLRPKAEMHDRFLSADNVQTVSVVAKSLGTGRDRLFRFLRDQKILMANNTPYQQFIERGYFRVIEKVINMGGNEVIKPQTFVTAKGVDYIARLLEKGRTA